MTASPFRFRDERGLRASINRHPPKLPGNAVGDRCWRGGTCGGCIQLSPEDALFCSVCGWEEQPQETDDA